MSDEANPNESQNANNDQKNHCKECNRNFDTAEALNQHNAAKHSSSKGKKESSHGTSGIKMKKSNAYMIVGLVIIILLIGFTVVSFSAPGKYDDFAKCLSEKGVKFYGAFWCSHCANQKAMFGKSFQYINYIECSEPDGAGQLPVCKDAGVKSYPTWEFANGTQQSGELSIQQLSERTGCPVPA